ncbi:MAG: extracellular solute-binding protein [Clostridiales bacterium]|nr:extracellular solute-binding protein [Clostridiales bacterium]
MKITIHKRMTALLLAFVIMTAVFSACSIKNAGGQDSSSVSKGFVYVPEYIKMPSGVTDMRYINIKNDMLYFCSQVLVGQETVTNPGGGIGIMPVTGSDLVVYEAEQAMLQAASGDVPPEETEASGEIETTSEEETIASEDVAVPVEEPMPMPMPIPEYTYDVYATRIFKMSMDGTNYEQLPGYEAPEKPEGVQGQIDIAGMCVDNNGNIWIVEQGNFYHYDEQGNYVEDERNIQLRKLDPTGAELKTIDLSSLARPDEYFYVGSLALDSQNNIYFNDGNQTVYAYTEQGTQKFKLEMDNWINSMLTLTNGDVAVMTWENDGNVLKPIDQVTGTWKSDLKVPIRAYNAYPGGGDYLAFFSDGTNLYGLKEGEEEPETLFNWINCDIDGNNISSLVILPDSRIACLSYAYSSESGSNMELAVLTKTDISQVPEKIYLSMATFYMDYTLRAKVIDFNKTNGKYRIEVTDYSEYSTQDDWEAGLTKLSTEIISGKVPDLICTSQQLPLHQYISKGLLEDLYPYIDNDPELGREMLVEDVFRALETNGKLYELSPNFSIFTVVGDPNKIGSDPGWTLDDLNKVMSEAPEGTMAFLPYIVRDEILQTSLTMNMEEYVDWSTGETKFDSPGFIKLLEFANTFPETYNWDEGGPYIDQMELLASGELLLNMMYMYDFNEFQTYRAIFGGNIAFKGFPCESKNGNAYIINSGLAMSKKCKDKDGAWAFMRILLTEEYQQQFRYWGFPTNKKVFDEKVKDAMTENTYIDENGNEVISPKNYWYMGNEPIEIYAMTQQELDQFMELLRSTDRVMSYDTSMMEIINTEAGAYFAGQKTAQDVAKIIQSRVRTYVNEQR